jgi:hypothetical protein
MTVFRHSLPWPSAWDPTLGMGTNLQLWAESFPLMGFAGVLAHLGASWSLIERVMILCPLALLIWLCPYIVFYRLLRSSGAAAIGALAFCLNTYTISLIQRGHLPALLAYSLMPAALYFALRSLTTPSLPNALCVTATLEAQFMFEPRYAYLSVLLMALLYVFFLAGPRHWIDGRRGRFIAFVGAALILLNLYWLLPTIAYPPPIPGQLSDVQAFIDGTKNESLLYAFANFHPYYHHVLSTDDFAATPVEGLFILLSLAALCGYVISFRSRLSKMLLIAWGAGTVFISGAQGPFGPLNQWVYTHLPGMMLFRESEKIMSVSSLCIAYGIASLVRGARKYRYVAPALGAAVLVAMVDAYNPLRLSNFLPYPRFAADVALRHFLAHRARPGRILYFPDTPLGVPPSQSHGSASAIYLFAWDFPPIGLANFATDPASAYGALDSRLAPSLLCEIGVRYVAVDPDPLATLYAPWYFDVTRGEALHFFGTRPWLRPVSVPQPNVTPRSRYEVFSLRGCRDKGPAFVSPEYVAFAGNEVALQSLVGTDLWSDHGVALLAADADVTAAERSKAAVVGELAFLRWQHLRAAENLRTSLASFDRRARKFSAAVSERRGAGFVIDPAAEERDPVPSGRTEAVVTLKGDAAYRVWAKIAPRYRSWGITSGRHGLVPLSEHPTIMAQFIGAPPARVTATLKLEGPDDYVTRTCMFSADRYEAYCNVYDQVEDQIIRARSSSIEKHHDSLSYEAQMYSGPISDAADYSLISWRFDRGLSKRLRAQVLAFPKTILGGPAANLEAVRSQSMPKAFKVRSEKNPLTRIDLPLSIPENADYLSFDTISDSASAITLSLRIYDARTRAGREVAVPPGMDSVSCVGDAASAGPDLLGALTVPDEETLPSVECHRLPIHLVLQSLFPSGSIPSRVTLIVAARGKLSLRDIAFETDRYREDSSNQPLPGSPPVIAVDGVPITLQLRGASARSAAVLHLRSGVHRIALIPGSGSKIESAAFLPLSARALPIEWMKETFATDSEIAGHIKTDGGMFVFPQAYSPGWRLAFVPPGFSLSGWPVLDSMRLREHFMPGDTHTIVNGNLNGWRIPRYSGQVAIIFMPTVLSFIGAAATLIALIIILFAASIGALTRSLGRRPSRTS